MRQLALGLALLAQYRRQIRGDERPLATFLGEMAPSVRREARR